MKLVDAHSHAYNYKRSTLDNLKNKFIIVGVSEDLKTSIESLKLSERYKNIVPAVGIHPWYVHKMDWKEELKQIEKIIVSNDKVKIIGEIGLDKARYRKTIDIQLKVFEELVKMAKDYNLAVNIHSAGTSGKIFQILTKYDISKAYFHWYTGSLPLLKQIEDAGYFIGINVVFERSKNNFEAAKNVNLRNVLFESDGPYRARGIDLSTTLVEETMKKFSELRDIKYEKLVKIIYKNFRRYVK